MKKLCVVYLTLVVSCLGKSDDGLSDSDRGTIVDATSDTTFDYGGDVGSFGPADAIGDFGNAQSDQSQASQPDLPSEAGLDSSNETDLGRPDQSLVDQGVSCDDEQLACGEMCVDFMTDPAHCGDCDEDCGSDQICQAGECVLPPATCPAGGCPPGSYCDLALDLCIAGCLADESCPEGQICNDRECVPGCRDDLGCSDAESCLDELCTGCEVGFGNCDRAADDLCETSLLSDDDHCGGCDLACDLGADRRCIEGSCECANGTSECGGTCVDTSSSDDNCGRCDFSCDDPDHGSSTCEEGRCRVACASGYHQCNGACVPDNAVESCGSRCTPCPSATHGSAVCEDEACSLECDEGYALDESECVERCETTGCDVGWCNEESGLCEDGCALHDQCDRGEFCLVSSHECVRTVDNSCPEGYRYVSTCSSGASYCTHRQLPSGTFYAARSCPEGFTVRGSWYCSLTTVVCMPDD